MLVFVDESGDPGMNRKLGTSDFFVVCAVLFFENEDAARCDSAIAELRKKCFGRSNQEFKFNKCCEAHRVTFLTEIVKQDFLYMGFILNKRRLYGPGFKFKSSFYKYTCKLLFQNAKGYLNKATVVIDGCGDREFRLELQNYLKDKINTEAEAIRKVKIEGSHNNNLLQLADMIVGSVARSLRRDKHDCHKYRAIIGCKEIGIQTWPKKYAR